MKITFIFLVVVFVVVSLNAKTEIGGVLHRDTRLSIDESPFIVTSDIFVPQGVRLTVSPGVRIIIGALPSTDTVPGQIDRNDSAMISIKIEGTLSCAGKRDRRISFQPDTTDKKRPVWYGILLNRAEDGFTEIAFTDIVGAYCGVTIKKCVPILRNALIEYNHIGIQCSDVGSARIQNCIVAHNSSSGIRIVNANPQIVNSIILHNRNNGIWCDGSSAFSLRYSCIFGNNDGNLLECDPEVGYLVTMNGNRDSIDCYGNIFKDPVFTGTVAEMAAQENDIALPTEVSTPKKRIIADIVNHGKKAGKDKGSKIDGRYILSDYSPCSNAGDPSKKFNDVDGSTNDMGMYGGPDHYNGK